MVLNPSRSQRLVSTNDYATRISCPCFDCLPKVWVRRVLYWCSSTVVVQFDIQAFSGSWHRNPYAFFGIPHNPVNSLFFMPHQVFQTFACTNMEEIGKRYLKADLRIDCDTPEHRAYEIYARIMFFICELCFLGAFCLALQKYNSKTFSNRLASYNCSFLRLY